MQTEEEGKPEAYLLWIEGQGIPTERDWRHMSREQAIAQLHRWMENVGLALQNGEIVEH